MAVRESNVGLLLRDRELSKVLQRDFPCDRLLSFACSDPISAKSHLGRAVGGAA